jgi:hypothetical protein
MMKQRTAAVACILSFFMPFCVRPQIPVFSPTGPSVTSAVDGIITAFRSHPLVGLGDWHGMAQEEDFYAELVKDPRFAAEVGNVVVEFGGAAQQETIDRYVRGEDISYEQLRTVWTEQIGFVPTVTGLGYLNFFAQVRSVNSKLAPGQQIHVWLGDPPIDWSKIKTREQGLQVVHERDRYPAGLIKTEILDKQRKALIIYGTLHFYDEHSLKSLIEEAHPNAFFLVTPYIGFQTEQCSAAFEKTTSGWPFHALANLVGNGALRDALKTRGCRFIKESDYHFAPEVTEADRTKALSKWEDEMSGAAGDAILYLGKAESLTMSPTTPDLYLDLAFRKEIDRRWLIMSGHPLSPTEVVTAPRYLHTYAAAAGGN